MAITARLESKTDLGDGRVQVVIVTSDTARGDTTHTIVLSAAEATGPNLKRIVLQRLASLDAVASLPPVGTTVDLAPIVDPTPDPAVVARETWLRNYRRLRAARQLIADGVPVDAGQVTTLQNTVNAGFLPAYLDFV